MSREDIESYAPSFQFYPGDWLSSAHITLMTPAEEGGYIRLLSHCWGDKDCSLPTGDTELAMLSRLGDDWFNGSGDKIKKCFIPHPTRVERCSNKRLLEERLKQAEFRKKNQKLEKFQLKKESKKCLLKGRGLRMVAKV